MTFQRRIIVSDYVDIKGKGKLALHVTEGDRGIEVEVPGGGADNSVHLEPAELEQWINYYSHALALHKEANRLKGKAAEL